MLKQNECSSKNSTTPADKDKISTGQHACLLISMSMLSKHNSRMKPATSMALLHFHMSYTTL